MPYLGIDGDFSRFAPAADFFFLLRVVRPLLFVTGTGFLVAIGAVEILCFGLFGAVGKGGVPFKGFDLVARSD